MSPMDLNRIGDPAYIAELKAAQLAKSSDHQYIDARLALLEDLATAWKADDLQRPYGLSPPNVSTNEYIAIALATHRESEFKQPVAQFLMLEPWLQAWVLRKWRLERYIGLRVGLNG